MAQKTIEVIISGKDESSGAINSLKSAIGDLTGSISAAQVAFYKLSQAVGEHIQKAVNGAIEQDKANQQLITSLKQEGLYTEANLKSLLNLSDARQKITRFTDEETIAAQAYLVTIGLSVNQVKQYTPLIQDMAEKVALVTGEQANLGAMAKLVGMAMDDNFGRMKMAGIILTENEEKTIKSAKGNEKLSEIYQILTSRVKDTASEMGKSLAGQMKINLQMIDEEYEKLGKQLIPTYIAWKETLLILARGFNEAWKAINIFYDLAMAGSQEVARGFLNLSRIGIEGFKSLRDFLFDLGIDKIFNVMMTNVMNILSNVINYIKGFVEKVNIGGIANDIIKKLSGAVEYTKNLSTGFKKAGEDLDETKKISDKGFSSIITGLENSIKYTTNWRNAYVQTALDIIGINEDIQTSNQKTEEANTSIIITESENRINYRQLEADNLKINYLIDENEKEETEKNKTEIEKYYSDLRMQEVKVKMDEMQAAAKKREQEETEHIKKMNEINAPYFTTFKNSLKDLADQYGNHTIQMKTLAAGAAGALNNSFQTLFFNIFHGSLKDGLKNFGETFLRGMEAALIQFLASAAVAKFLIFLGLSSIVPGATAGGAIAGGAVAGTTVIGGAAAGGAAAGGTAAAGGGAAAAFLPIAATGGLIMAGLTLLGSSGYISPEEAQNRLNEYGSERKKYENKLLGRIHPITGDFWGTETEFENIISHLRLAKYAYDNYLPVAKNYGATDVSYEYAVDEPTLKLIRTKFPEYQLGGIIEGLPSQSRLIMAHGREKIIPYGSPDYNQSNNTANNVININFESVSIREERDIKSLADMIMEKIDRKNDLLAFGIA